VKQMSNCVKQMSNCVKQVGMVVATRHMKKDSCYQMASNTGRRLTKLDHSGLGFSEVDAAL
jgi:hypothetical protein